MEDEPFSLIIHDDLAIVNGDFHSSVQSQSSSSYGSGHGVTQWPWYMMVLVSMNHWKFQNTLKPWENKSQMLWASELWKGDSTSSSIWEISRYFVFKHCLNSEMYTEPQWRSKKWCLNFEPPEIGKDFNHCCKAKPGSISRGYVVTAVSRWPTVFPA